MLRMRLMRPQVLPDNRHDIRLQEDPHIRVGRIPLASVRVPQRGDVVERQHERGFHRKVLAFEGVHGPPRVPGSHRFLGPSLGGRDIRPKMEIEEGDERWEGAPRPLKEPVRDLFFGRWQ